MSDLDTVDDTAELPLRRRASSAPGPAAPTAKIEPDAPKITRSADDPRRRAAERAAELLEHVGTMDQGQDKFAFDTNIVPDGWSYEWKRLEIFGKQDPAYQVSLARSGWDAVPSERHPEMMPQNWKGGTIEREGMILMERPTEITDMVKANDLRRARNQVRQKEEQLSGAGAGEFSRDNKGNSLVKIKKSYEAMAIPKDPL